MSNLGMAVNAYKLAEFIDKNYPNLLPNRSNDAKWIADFCSTDHFAYNQNIPDGMPGFLPVVKNKQVGNFHIKELIIQEGQESNRLILKVEKQDYLSNMITVQYNISMQGHNFIAPLQMFNIKEIFPPRHKIYVGDIRKDVKVNDLINITN